MKKITLYVIILAGLLCIISSCKNFLQEKLTTTPTVSYYSSSANGFESGVNATYARLRNFYAKRYGMLLTVYGTDIWIAGSDGEELGTYDTKLNSSNFWISADWKNFYSAINQANTIVALDSVNISGVSDEAKTEGIAEVRFLRALYYFNLVRLFGPVTLTLKPTKGVQTKATRAPAKEIYSKAIIPDLQFAINHLPVKQEEYGRATKPAAQMLLSKVYLTRGYTDFAQPKDFSKAATLAEDVINNYNFKLVANYKKLFDINNQENSEMIWGVQFSHKVKLNANGNLSARMYRMEYDVLPGMKRTVADGTPWKRFKPTKFLLSLWNRKTDVRWKDDFKRVFYCNNPNNITKGEDGNPKFSVGDTAIYLPGHPVSKQFKSSKPYMVIAPNDYTRKLYLSLTKFDDPTRQTTQQKSRRNWVIMRLSGTYLTAAEAYFKMGDKDDAAKALNMVRERAAKPGKKSAMKISPSDVTLSFILNERARELCGEAHRWFTLKRTHTLITRVRKYNKDAAPFIKPYHVKRPIPQDQIDRVSGTYKQNPGY
jgi:hypothetical protein